MRLLQAEQASRVSNQLDMQSNYHLELLEEKREEIQNIIRKRQRKAALASLVKENVATGKPTMAGLITRGSKVDSMLPDITVKNPQISVDNLSKDKSNEDDNQTENLLGEDNYKKLKKYDRAESDSDIDV